MSGHRLVSGALVLVVLLGRLAMPAAPARAAHPRVALDSPSITLAPPSGQPDASVTVIGVNFVPDDYVFFHWDDWGSAQVGQATTDANGSFSSAVRGPSAGGDHVLVVVAQSSIRATASYNAVAATATPVPTETAIPTDTPVPTATSIPQGPSPGHPSQYCTGLFGWCPNLGDLWNAITGAVFGTIADFMGGAFTTVTAPFSGALTSTPNLAKDGAWSGLQTYQTALSQMAGTMFVAFLVLGMMASYFTAIGAGSFTRLTGPIARAIVVTGFVAGYQAIFGDVIFPGINGLASVIESSPILATETGFDAIGKAFMALSNVISLDTLINLLILIAAVIVGILAVIIRDMGLGILMVLYALGPLALITWLSPQFEFIARWWFRTFVSVALWPVGYAIALKITGGLFAATSWTGLMASIGALGMVVLLYRVPGIMGSMAGSSTVGDAATAITNTSLIAMRVAATRAIGAVTGGK